MIPVSTSAPRISQVVIHAGTFYLAGQVADNPVPAVRSQTDRRFDQMNEV